MSEIELHQNVTDLSVQMDYAKAVSTGSLLPRDYQNNPANVLIAVGLGQSMGLSPAESLYRITVIQGKPTASAELIAANVRKAGHKLRVRGDDSSATAQIVRADDPDYTFEVTRDIKWAQQMKLTDKDNYKKQPGTMLQWRAITAVARLACPEALYGVAYSSDEMFDDERPTFRPAPAASTSAADRMRDALGTTTVEQVPNEPAPDAPAPLNPSSKLARHMFALMGEVGITEREDRLLYVTDTVGREVTSSKDMTEDDAHRVIASLEADRQPAEAGAES